MLRLAAGGLCTGLAAAAVACWWRFRRFLRDERDAVRAAASAPTPRTLAALLDSLPPPVRRFFERSISGDACLRFRLWEARGAGGLRFDSGGGWKALASLTTGAVAPEPAFCYTGSLQLGLGRLLPCLGREAFLKGRGAMVWRLWGAVPLAEKAGGQLDQSGLLRWLAEAVLFPPALLPSPHLRWLPARPGEAAGPDRSARAEVACGGVSISAVLTFDEEGRFRELVSHDYWRVMPDGCVARMPWRARAAGGYARFSLGGGCSVEAPIQLEAAWLEPNGTEFTHIRFTLTSLAAE